jgi:hypothetical protein
LLLVDLNTAPELAHAVVCLAVDQAEGEEIYRRAELPGQETPEPEQKRAAELTVDEWQIAEVLSNVLAVDSETFAAFQKAVRACVERALVEQSSPARELPPTPESPLDELVTLLCRIVNDVLNRDFERPVTQELAKAQERIEQLRALSEAALRFACQRGIPFTEAENRIRAAVAAAENFLQEEGGFTRGVDGEPIAMFTGKRPLLIKAIQCAIEPVRRMGLGTNLAQSRRTLQTPEIEAKPPSGQRGGQTNTYFPPEWLDPSRCPGCKTPVPDRYRTLPKVACPTCGAWVLIPSCNRLFRK